MSGSDRSLDGRCSIDLERIALLRGDRYRIGPTTPYCSRSPEDLIDATPQSVSPTYASMRDPVWMRSPPGP